MSELKELYGVYLGKEFKKEGITQKEGQEDKPWKMFSISVREKDEDNFPKKLTAFASMKGFDDVTESDFVKVLYKESKPTFNEKAGKEIKYKTAVMIEKFGKDKVPKQQEPEPEPEQTPKKNEITIELLKEIFIQYNQKVPTGERTLQGYQDTLIKTLEKYLQ